MNTRPNIYEAFAAYTVLPIKVDDVIAQVKEYKSVDEIVFIPMDVNPEVLLGIHRMVLRNGVRICEVYYAEYLNDFPDLKRLVCVKEILHILDDDEHTAKSVDAVSMLIEQIVVPPSSGISNSTASDKNGVMLALLVLAPRDAIEIARSQIKLGKMSVSDFATLAEIPETFARFALSDVWKGITDKIQ